MRSNAIYRLGAALCLLCALAVALTGCGGGGGGSNNGSGGSTSVTAIVLSVENGLPPAAGATVRLNGQTTTTDANGKFTLTNLSATPSGTITAANEQTMTLNLKLTPGVLNDLGTIYLSDTGYTATVTGRVVTATTTGTTPVGNATVTIGTQTTKTATDGTFTLNGLPVGLGALEGTVGSVTASGFETKPITAETLQFALVAGSNPIGDVVIAQPSGSIPGAPYTIKGVVTSGGAPAAGISIALSSGGVALGSTTTDSTGTYYFWVVPATYTINALSGSNTLTTTVTLSRPDTPVTAPTLAF